uniref:Putative aedine 6.5-8.5 protein family member n=1 Tax=Psorophora albipes TaxID=869069 RepID=T1D5Q1_9DIPT
MKLLVILSVFGLIFGVSLAAPQSSNYIPGSLQWFCSAQPGSTMFGDWLKGVVQPWLPPAVCQSAGVPSGTNNTSASAISSLFDSIV